MRQGLVSLQRFLEGAEAEPPTGLAYGRPPWGLGTPLQPLLGPSRPAAGTAPSATTYRTRQMKRSQQLSCPRLLGQQRLPRRHTECYFPPSNPPLGRIYAFERIDLADAP